VKFECMQYSVTKIIAFVTVSRKIKVVYFFGIPAVYVYYH